MQLEQCVQRDRSPFMLLGYPRSGTNFTTTILRSHPSISMLREPFSMHNGYIREHLYRWWSSNTFDSETLHTGLGEYPDSVAFFRDFRMWIGDCGNEKRGFKETTFLMKLGWMKKYLPDIDVVYIERNPLGVAGSFKKSGLFEKWRYQELFQRLEDDVRTYTNLEEHIPCVERTDRENWIDVVTTMHTIATLEARKDILQFRHMSVSYETLVMNPEEEFSKILTFLGLNLCESVTCEIQERQSETRGGTFSTYRDTKDIQGYTHILAHDEIKFIRRKYGGNI